MANNMSTLIASLSSSDTTGRVNATEQLARLGSEAQPAALALVLACGDDDEEVRQGATSVLEELGPPGASDMGQLASLVGAKSPDVGYWAATLLGRLKAQAAPAVEVLALAIAESPNLSVRQRAAWALGQIGPAAVASLPHLKKAAGDTDTRLARLVQEAIKQIDEP